MLCDFYISEKKNKQTNKTVFECSDFERNCNKKWKVNTLQQWGMEEIGGQGKWISTKHINMVVLKRYPLFWASSKDFHLEVS